MTNKEAIIWIERLSGEMADKLKIDKMKLTDYINLQEYVFNCEESLKMAMESLKETEWIPFLFDEEGWLTEKTPQENEKILVSSSDKIWQDTWICDDDIVGLKSGKWLNGLAWRHMPKCWKEVGK